MGYCWYLSESRIPVGSTGLTLGSQTGNKDVLGGSPTFGTGSQFPFYMFAVLWSLGFCDFTLHQLHYGIQHKALKESRRLWWLSSAACHDERLMSFAPSALTLPKTMWQSTLCYYCFQEQLLLSPNCLHQLATGSVFYMFILWDLPL